jgi:hypothetical protein
MWQMWDGLAQALAGRSDAALLALAPLAERPAGDSLGRVGRMTRAALKGDDAAFDAEMTDDALASIRRDGQYSYHVAEMMAALGRINGALDWLENAVNRTFVPVTLFETDRLLAPIRGDPRFARIFERARQVAASVPDAP